MPIFSLILVVISTITGALAHPIKMTTSKVSVNEKDRKIEVVTNLYFDDFQSHLHGLYNTDIEPLTESEKEVIEDYFRKNFIITSNTNEPIKLDFSSAELINDNMIQIKMEATNYFSIASVSSLKITNTLLLDAFPKEQENIVHVVMAKSYETQMLLFSSNESRQLVKFN